MICAFLSNMHKVQWLYSRCILEDTQQLKQFTKSTAVNRDKDDKFRQFDTEGVEEEARAIFHAS